MKAWVVRKHGDAGALRLIDFPLKNDRPDQIRVRVKAVGLNHLDLWVRNGVSGHRFPLPMILGCDVAGVVDSDSDLDFPKGSSVLINPILQGDDLVDPKTGKKHRFGLIGETRHGGLSEWIYVSKSNLLDRGNIDAVQAAALPVAYITAFNMIYRKSKLKSNEWVLIQAGGSGVGVACIQFAHTIGAKIITTVGSDEKVLKAKNLGVHHVINYKKENFKNSFKKICKAESIRGVDVAIDHIGESTFSKSMESLNWYGRLVTCGATSGSEVKIDLKPLFFKNLSILGSTMGDFSDLSEILKLVQAEKLKPVIDSVMPFEDVPKALAKLEERSVFGKIIIKL